MSKIVKDVWKAILIITVSVAIGEFLAVVLINLFK